LTLANKKQGESMLDIIADIIVDLVVHGIVTLTSRAMGSGISAREKELLDHSIPGRSTTLTAETEGVS
jgi:hypothetical protein